MITLKTYNLPGDVTATRYHRRYVFLVTIDLQGGLPITVL